MKHFIVISIIIALIGLNSFAIINNMKDPRSVVIPNDSVERIVNKKYRRAIDKLEDDDRKMLMYFFANWSSSGGGDYPEGFTIGAAIDAQTEILMGVGHGL